jgi:hypothetical protein
MVYSQSGVAELDCIFRTALPEEPEAIWTCSRYEPDQAIDYVVFTPGRQMQHLSIRLSEPAPGKTELVWRRAFSALTPEAETALDRFVETRLKEINRLLTVCLEHYLATGKLWKAEVATA